MRILDRLPISDGPATIIVGAKGSRSSGCSPKTSVNTINRTMYKQYNQVLFLITYLLLPGGLDPG